MASESTHFNFDDFSSEIQDLTPKGDAYVPTGETFYRLTKTDDSGNPQKSSVGAIVYSKPVLFKASTGKLQLKTTIVFSITAVDDTPADGIAFFITRSLNFRKDGSHGNFGIFEPHSGTAPGLVAVEFDIFHNHWDTTLLPHIGINLESRKSLAPKDDTSLTGQQVTAVISYDETNQIINVHVNGRSEVVTYPCDLSGILGNKVYVGISSSTGDHVALHDIYSWSFDSDIVPY